MQTPETSDALPAKKEEPPRRRGKRFSELLLVTLALLLMVSLVANVWQLRLVRKYAGLSRFSRRDLAAEAYYGPDNASLPAPDPGTVRIVFAGDSDIEMWDPLPEVKGAQVVQRGIGGDRSSDLLLRLESDVIDLKPAIAVITIGGNDLEDIGLFPDQEQAITVVCLRNIRVIVERLREHHIQVVLLTIFPWGDVDLKQCPTWSDATYTAVQRVNAGIRALGGPGVTVLDCDPLLGEANGRRKTGYSEDSEHLNTAGYQAVEQALVPILKSLVKRASSKGGDGTGPR